MEQLELNFSNIHCEDCEITIRHILSNFFILVDFEGSVPKQDELPNVGSALYKQRGNNVNLYYTNHGNDLTLEKFIKKILKKLSQGGFEVISWDYYVDDNLQLDSKQDNTFGKANGRVFDEFPDIMQGIHTIWHNYKQDKLKRQHLKSCTKCQAQQTQELINNKSDSEDSVKTVVVQQEKEFRAVFYVGGMTCASCVGSVNDAIDTVLHNSGIKSKYSEPNYSVNLVQHSAVVVVPNKPMINQIINQIEDSGFECRVLEVLPVERSINSKVTAIIDGISCAACTVSITNAVENLPFILDCTISSVTKTGVFVMEESEDNLKTLITTIEDCGFDVEINQITKINYVSGKKQSRTINLSVDGMYCNHCPDLISNYLHDFGQVITIEDELTLDHPFIKFTYVPNPGKNLTLRRILEDLNHLRDSDSGYVIDYSREGSFKCELVIPMSMDEKLRILAKKEVWKIARRLILATIFAIPTFIFGVVAMSLLPKHNKFYMWVDEPLWTGNVSRNTWILLFLSTPVYFFAADVFHTKALTEVKSLWMHKNSFKRRLFKFGSMNLLMCLGTSVAYWSSIVLLILSSQQEPMTDKAFKTTYFDTVVFLTFFLLIGRLLESVSKNKTGNAILGLGNLKTSKATLVDKIIKDGNEENEDENKCEYTNDRVLDVKFLEIDDFIRISPGDSPPVDCVIVANEAEFDESALTGESKPVKHYPGHQIFSGTVNVSNQSIIAKILSLESDSLIDQILNTVREGQLRKAPIERMADTLTGYFVPIIVLLAIIVFIIWISLSYSGRLPPSYLDIDIGGWAMWSLEFSIAVFCIACPCGIGLAAPTALFVGSGLAAKFGILVKGGGAAFQDAANVNIVCFDKTGTLTYGDLRVSDYIVLVDEKFKTIGFQLSRDLELSSKHPIGEAIKTFVKDSSLEVSNNKVPNVETIPGKGLKGDIILQDEGTIWNELNPSKVILGNESLFKDYDVEISPKERDLLNTWKNERKSIILVGIQCEDYFHDVKYHLILMLACRDQIRSESKSIISQLTKMGIETYMITGDNSVTAKSIAVELGIPEANVVSEVLPTDKQNKVKYIKSLAPKNMVAMVGDGINDAPALATADIGIALSSGTDLAVTSSDFILLNKSHPLSSMVTLLDLSKTVFNRVKFNFGWALVYNVIGIPIAAGVIYPINNSRLSPVWASAAMAASSVSVVTSSLALNLYRPKVKLQELEDTYDEPVNEVKFK